MWILVLQLHFGCEYLYQSVQSQSCGFLSFLGHLEVSAFPGFSLDMISFMWVHWDTWENSRGHHEIGVVLRNVFEQTPFPKHLFTPRTPYGHIRPGFWRFRIFPVCRLPSTFVRWYPDSSAPFLPPCVLVSLDSRLELFVDDGLNSTVAKICRVYFWCGTKIIFFWTENPIRCDFLRLGWLVGQLWFDTTFKDVCHPKKITGHLV